MVKPHVTHNTGNNEWYTPKEYISAAILTMGQIDLDPASTLEANEVVQARTIYTVQDNGLEQKWVGRIWLNPPYARKLIEPFCNKLLVSLRSKDVTEAIVLVNNATETKWFQALAKESRVIMFPFRRIKFWCPDKGIGSPLQGQAIFYFGSNCNQFIEAYKDFGLICTPKKGLGYV